jgi:subtilase family serine protease
MQARRRVFAAASAVTAAASMTLTGAVPGGVASAGAAPAGHAARAVLVSTTPGTGTAARRMAPASRVRVSVFVGRDRAGLAAAALGVSDPASPRYRHYLTPAQVQARYGATAAQQAAVSRWLTRSGLVVTHRDGFVIAASGAVSRAQAAVAAPLALSRPRGGVEQIVPSRVMSVPASIASSITTIRVAPAAVPVGPHEPMKQASTTTTTAALGPGAGRAGSGGSRVKEACSAYYGQKKASQLPGAYGRTLTWSPCGYLPQQLRHAYGATRAGLTGRGVSIAIISEDDDTSALADANRWARTRDFPPFAPGQFSANIAPHAINGLGDIESALDVESAHGMAPAARLSYVVGNGTITGDRLLDPLDTIVTQHIADVVSSSWFEGYMPVPQSMITAWEGVLQRAAVEGITVNFATGDYGDSTPLQYPGSDPWITTVGGTSLAVGAHGSYLWEAGWETDESVLADHATTWKPAPPGYFGEGSTGGVSKTFAEPYYQRGVVSGNVVAGHAMRTVPDVSALGDWNLGYQIGVSVRVGAMTKYFNEVNGGTSLSSPMFTGFEADLIQGRGGIALGFANPLLYDMANTRAFHDITGAPQGQGVTEAVVYGLVYQQNPPSLATMGQCGSTKHLSCGPGYDTVSGLGSPGPTFFSSFGSHPR